VNRALLIAAVLAGCSGEIDPQWQLDHDRIIAVRASPPGLGFEGDSSVLDVLIGAKGAAPTDVDPDMAVVTQPTNLTGALAMSGTHWTITQPADADLAIARDLLGLDVTDPVPLRVEVTMASTGFVADKTVWLDEALENPVLGAVMIDGVDATTETMLTVAPVTDIPVAVDFDDTYDINWLTSCGTMHDFDLATAYLRVETADPQTGTLGVLVRDPMGGTVWQLWPIAAQ